MPKIKKIQVTSAAGCIPADFELDELPSLLVITGENNTGKSTFMRLITPTDKGGKGKGKFLLETGDEINPTVVYIAAENILPSENEAKASAKSAALVKNMSALLSSLGLGLDLKQKAAIDECMDALSELATQNLSEFTGKNDHSIKLNPKDQPDGDAIVQLLIDNMEANEGDDKRKFVELGQGTQRLIITALLKAYADMIGQQEDEDKRPGLVLVLLEEPEIYLHPGLKKKLNEALVEISRKDNHQVIISTHDPYFAYTNMYGDDSSVISFIKENGETRSESGDSFTGVEDELLHIYLFNKVMNNLSPNNTGTSAGSRINTELISAGSSTRKYSMTGKKTDEDGADYALPLYIRHIIHHKADNEYDFTDDELKESIKKLSEILNNNL